jgi:NAD(P)H-nitrite reductase large subunit
MMKTDKPHVAIIGNGIAGVTAARFIRKWSDMKITLISSEAAYFFSRPALMYVYMGHLRAEDTRPYADDFWVKNHIELVHDHVEHIDTNARTLTLRREGSIPYNVLIIATGSTSKFFDWPGQNLEGVQGFYGLPDLERMQRATPGISRAVVLGGGLIGIELAEMLHARRIPTTFLVREKSYMDMLLPEEESSMINDEIRTHQIDLRLETEMSRVNGDAAGRVRSVTTSAGEEVPCQFVGVATGVTPNVAVTRGSPIETNRGILVDDYHETNVPGVFAIGDCAEFRKDGVGYRRIDQLWYTGRLQGRSVARIVCGHRSSYTKPLFFNSAKFFTIEYQTYGTIDPIPSATTASVCWHNERAKQLVRINYESATGRVLGCNSLGIRLRHAVCERWMLEERSIDYVCKHLWEAGFDPEFFRRYEPHFVDAYTRTTQNTNHATQNALSTVH